jgi:hypothetical protein
MQLYVINLIRYIIIIRLNFFKKTILLEVFQLQATLDPG